jgi:hypothetical protein
LAPSRFASGHPIVLTDPHTPWSELTVGMRSIALHPRCASMEHP